MNLPKNGCFREPKEGWDAVKATILFNDVPHPSEVADASAPQPSTSAKKSNRTRANTIPSPNSPFEISSSSDEAGNCTFRCVF